jgi:hypothetical protein
MGKEVVMVKFKLSWHLPGGLRKTIKKPRPEPAVSRPRFEPKTSNHSTTTFDVILSSLTILKFKHTK